MWSSSVSSHGAGGVNYGVGGAGQYRGGILSDGKKDDVDSDKTAISNLLKELTDAEKTSKNQTVQEVRDKLNAKRKELGDEKFKEILEELKKDASEGLLAQLKRMFPDLFPDDSAPTPSPAPSPGGGGGGGGGGGSVNPSNFGPKESMSNKPFTQGANHANYTPDKSDPGKKPGMGKEAGNIWTGFKQGPDGNCTTVSAIKAAMMKFGQKPTDVFKDVKEAGDGYDVQMRDGFQLHLSKGELQVAAQQARFLGDDPAMMTDANFLYAASAKRAQMENNDGTASASFLQATVTLNDGEYGRESLERLGLKNHYRTSSSSELANGALGVVDFGGHSMAVVGGRLELWGSRGGRPQEGNAYALI
ncbi:hypothetical protein [Pseudomonas sp. ICMP 460]|uniref:hypothetical protein n=1 Tax=Pseudomonas sp. ICMP 460 TaxID=1718917 RepID=UPI0015A9054E|nr:hypothetical protein [Pseudomonas sp. ICMP 460]